MGLVSASKFFTRVGLLIPQSSQLYIAILGILKSGGAYIPLDPEYPDDRIEYIRSDDDVRAILHTAGLAQEKAISVPEIVYIDIKADAITLESIDYRLQFIYT